jgi:hypothetical protein
MNIGGIISKRFTKVSSRVYISLSFTEELHVSMRARHELGIM